jgi:hypothetical protein
VGWDPWAELDRREHIVLARARLPAGVHAVYARRGARAAILLDVRLPRRDRRAVLAHELVHDERGGGADVPGMPAAWTAVVAREERAVDAEVARRLVPPRELEAFVRTRDGLGDAVTLHDLAEEFDVPTWVAETAMRRAPPAAAHAPGPLTTRGRTGAGRGRRAAGRARRRTT